MGGMHNIHQMQSEVQYWPVTIGKSDLIDIDCIDQSVEIDDTLVSFIDLLILIFTDFINLYWCNNYVSDSC